MIITDLQDFAIGKSTIKFVETKPRLSRTCTGDFQLTSERFSKIGEILPLISKDVHTVLERAFDLNFDSCHCFLV
jgi:hypothetical protein